MNLEKLEKKKEKNKKQRRKFVKFWARYVKEHPDKEWSEQQNVIVDSQLISNKDRDRSKE